MTCSNCQHEITNGAKFCGSCGFMLLYAQPQPQVQLQQPQPNAPLTPEPAQTSQQILYPQGPQTLPQTSPALGSQSPQGYSGPVKVGMFSRRMNGLGFVLGQLYLMIILVIFFILFLILSMVFSSSDGYSLESSPGEVTYNIVITILSIALVVTFIVVQISLYVRRLHDLGKSGFYYFLTFVPIVSFIMWVYLIFAAGNKAPNKYGNPVPSSNFMVVLGFKKPKPMNTDLNPPHKV